MMPYYFTCPKCGGRHIEADVTAIYTRVPLYSDGFVNSDGSLIENEIDQAYCGDCGTPLEIASWSPPLATVMVPPKEAS